MTINDSPNDDTIRSYFLDLIDEARKNDRPESEVERIKQAMRTACAIAKSLEEKPL